MRATIDQVTAIVRGLNTGGAPEFLANMLTMKDCQMNVRTESGNTAQLSIDTFRGNRTASLEYCEGGTLHRISLEEEGFRYKQIALYDGAADVLDEPLTFELICQPNPVDSIQEWLEVIRS